MDEARVRLASSSTIGAPELEELLRKYPALGEQIVPRLERVLVEEINQYGRRSRFALDGFSSPSSYSGTISISEGPAGFLAFGRDFAEDSGEIRISDKTGFPELPFGPNSVHRYRGKVDIGVTFVGEGDKLNRLTFAVIGKDYVYLRGKGKVILKDGRQYTLGY